MTSSNSCRQARWIPLAYGLFGVAIALADTGIVVAKERIASEKLEAALELLRHGHTGGNQRGLPSAWKEVAAAGPEDMLHILTAMKKAEPLAENWLRSAFDTIAERELQGGGALPTGALEKFVLDTEQSPRARRAAYEWLTKVDSETSTRLLPSMLNDPSLELRYDAVAEQLSTAKLMDSDENKLVLYQRLLRAARDKMQIRECAEALEALGQKPNMAEQLGFVVDWKVIGPFDNTDRAGFNTIHFSVDEVNLTAEYQGKHGPVKWKTATAEQKDLEDLGKVDLNDVLVEEKSVLAYAWATVVSAEERAVECRYESKEATKLWVNGEELAVNNVYHSGSDFDQYIVPCKLKQGENQIVLKVCQNEQTEPWTKPWDFRLRLTDELGGAALQGEVVRD